MKEKWLMPDAVVPIDAETTAALVAEIKRLIGVVGDLALRQALPQPEQMTVKEKVAQWMIQKGYATGHGDTIEYLLNELEWQVAEQEREECAKVCDKEQEFIASGGPYVFSARRCATNIRARGDK